MNEKLDVEIGEGGATVISAENPDEELWREEYERWKQPEILRLATCKCPNCSKELQFQSALIGGGDLNSQETKERIVFFQDWAAMRQLGDKRTNKREKPN